MNPYKDSYANIYNSFICNSHKLETSQISINWQMGKQKEQTINIYNNIDYLKIIF